MPTINFDTGVLTMSFKNSVVALSGLAAAFSAVAAEDHVDRDILYTAPEA